MPFHGSENRVVTLGGVDISHLVSGLSVERTIEPTPFDSGPFLHSMPGPVTFTVNIEIPNNQAVYSDLVRLMRQLELENQRLYGGYADYVRRERLMPQTIERGPRTGSPILDEIHSDEIAADAAAVMREMYAGTVNEAVRAVMPVHHRTHEFTQDPNEQATLCGWRQMGVAPSQWPDGGGPTLPPACGMWPEHHNHGPRADCVCQVCKPGAGQFEQYSIYTEDHNGGENELDYDPAIYISEDS